MLYDTYTKNDTVGEDQVARGTMYSKNTRSQQKVTVQFEIKLIKHVFFSIKYQMLETTPQPPCSKCNILFQLLTASTV